MFSSDDEVLIAFNAFKKQIVGKKEKLINVYFWPFGGDKQLVSTKLEHLTCLLQIYMLFPFENSYFKLTFFCIKT